MLKTTSPWLDATTLTNIRRGMMKSATWVDETNVEKVLDRWHQADELLRGLGEYVVSVIEAIGPSFLELVAEDIGRGAYDPPEEEGMLLPDDAELSLQRREENKQREKQRREENERKSAKTKETLAKAGRVWEKATTSPQLVRGVGGGASAGGADGTGGGRKRMKMSDKVAGKKPVGVADGVGSDSHSSPMLGDPAATDAIGRARARLSNLATANAAVVDPLGSALKISSAATAGAGAGAGAGADNPWLRINQRLDEDADTQDDDGYAFNETDAAAPSTRRGDGGDEAHDLSVPPGKKMKITTQRKPNARTVDWGQTQSGLTSPGSDGGDGSTGGYLVDAKGRKVYTRFSAEEAEELKRLVDLLGMSNWSGILEDGNKRGFFLHRTAVNLKDKWRTIEKAMKNVKRE